MKRWKVVLLFPLSFFLSFPFFLKLRKSGQHATKGKMGGEQRDSFETAGTKLNFNFAAPISD